MAERIPRHWAMDGVFPGAFGLWRGDDWTNRKRFVAEKGFHGSGVSLADLADRGRADLLLELGESHGQRYAVHLGVDYREAADLAGKQMEEAVGIILAFNKRLPFKHVLIVVKVPGNRFDREIGLPRQLKILEARLRPVVERCRADGLPVAIENHGDYYVSDLVELCGRVPGLEIQLDTGNCFLIGERPDLIPDAAFPLVRSTHWKDHHVRPNHKDLCFQLTGATLGRGNVGLDAIYGRLLRLHPDPASVCMRVEWVPDPERDPLECFADSLEYLKRISMGRFTGPAGE
ncbi:MAG: sugar phosphate isomerase/epimerase family protein [Oceanipulchritudo sp.]